MVALSCRARIRNIIRVRIRVVYSCYLACAHSHRTRIVRMRRPRISMTSIVRTIIRILTRSHTHNHIDMMMFVAIVVCLFVVLVSRVVIRISRLVMYSQTHRFVISQLSIRVSGGSSCRRCIVVGVRIIFVVVVGWCCSCV